MGVAESSPPPVMAAYPALPAAPPPGPSCAGSTGLSTAVSGGAGLLRSRNWSRASSKLVPSSFIASQPPYAITAQEISASQMPKRSSMNSFGPGWNTMRKSTITTAAIPSPRGQRAGRHG